MESTPEGSPAVNRRVLVVAASAEEATETFGGRFDAISWVSHDKLPDKVAPHYSILAVASDDRESFRRSVERLVIPAAVARPDLEIVLDLGHPRDGQANDIEASLPPLEEFEVLGLEPLGNSHAGVRLRPGGGDFPFSNRLRGLVLEATLLPHRDFVASSGNAGTGDQARRPRSISSGAGRALRRLTEGRRGGLLIALVLLALLPPLGVFFAGSDTVRSIVLVLLIETVALLALVTIYYARAATMAARRATRLVGVRSRAAARSARLLTREFRDQSSEQKDLVAALRRDVHALHGSVRDASATQPSREELSELETRLTAAQQDQLRQTQALANLFRLVDIRGALPPLGGWAASPDVALILIDEMIRLRPRTVVECGSGSSTLLMALTAAQYQIAARIVALEHDQDFAQATRELLERHGVASYAEVRHAPLRPTSLSDHRAAWYDESALEGIADVGLLFVDGPPRSTGTRARLPAVPLLQDRMAEECTIILDDTARPDEREVATKWADMLPDFSAEFLDLQKGAALLRRR